MHLSVVLLHGLPAESDHCVKDALNKQKPFILEIIISKEDGVIGVNSVDVVGESVLQLSADVVKETAVDLGLDENGVRLPCLLLNH